MFNFTIKLRYVGVFGLFMASSFLLLGQSPQGQPATGAQAPAGQNQAEMSTPFRPDYVLGADDQILIRVPQEDQINERPFRIDTDGFVTLPVAGRIHAAGLTVQALETQVANQLSQYVRNPLVSITVVQYRSEPVFFVGEFRAPGVYPLQGRRTLVEMLAAVGGILPDAGRRIRVTRRAENGPIPLPNAVVDPEKKVSTVEVSLRSLTENVNPAEDIVLKAYDIVSVDRAERVYVNGEVLRSTAVEMGQRDYVSVIQALTAAGGLTLSAVRDKVVVLRPIMGTNRRAAIEVDMKRVYRGEDINFPLLPNDVVYVPRAATRTFLAGVGTAMVGSIPYLIVTILLRP